MGRDNKDKNKGTGYHFGGMERMDGGDRRWDLNKDGKLDWIEEHRRREFDMDLMKFIEGDDN